MEAQKVAEVVPVGDPKVLDHTKPQPVTYCIPLWLRDEQVRVNTKRVRGRIERPATGALRPEPVAIVGYGPSLADEWEKLRDFKVVISCSGAHRFLIDRGIVPTYHVEVDPRKHKVGLVGAPHPDVEYLVASTCHPSYFEHLGLDNPKVKLWHVYSEEEGPFRDLPPNEWSLKGGCGAGLRCLTIAAFLGFRDLHLFGMDGSEGATGKHAGPHSNQPKGHSVVVVGGREYRTTPAYLEAARQTFHELDQMPEVKATFHGEGLTQAMAREWVRKAPRDKVIAFLKEELITPEYRELNKRLHRENLAYGVNGGKHAATVLKLVEKLKTNSVLDYGCGKGYLAKALPFPIWEYDPAIEGKDSDPRPADLVVCADVLEHVEVEKIDFVLAHLASVTKKIGYLVVHTGPSKKFLADGRNAHVLQRDKNWWANYLGIYFKVERVHQVGPELFVVVSPKKFKVKKVKKEGA